MVVLCIITATTFWVLNALNKDDYNTIVDFPIEFTFDESRYVAVSELPRRLEIEINGNGWDLLRKYFNINETPFLIELGNAGNTDYLLSDDLERPLAEFISPTELVSILNDSLIFNIDRIETARLRPVLDSNSYSLAENHRLISKPVFTPDQITVQGASSILESFAGEFPIDLDETRINANLSKEITLEVPRNLENLLSLENEKVEVSMEIVPFLEGNQTLKPVRRNFPRSASIVEEEDPIIFYYLLDSREIEKFQELEFEAILDYSQRNREDSTLNVRVNPLPKYVELIRIEPSTVKLKYE
ncbi:YbbR-like domain-containing protein [Algoriphagus sediminis]|uniref:YbbR-like domain-containing protein n=1 Tax=Algoriphagus sediminis TaxID=3057113 RepID=A0ABT7YEC9_9BACT|nr:YbbR-like domain-containing protein [Algoriphagus sediminis]MDN3204880.1 YbbR-like domain-containing protein [Algoriphagus sediminis]